MGNTTEIQFAVNSYKASSGLLSSERLVNFFAEAAPPSSPFRGSISGTAGLKTWLNLNRFEPMYGSIILGDFLYFVCGLGFYQINKSKDYTLRGTLSGAPNRVIMDTNRTQVTILTSNGDSYYFDSTDNTFAKIVDLDYEVASSLTSLNGYTIFSKLESDQFFISDLNDTTSYSALKRATAESRSDNLVRVFAINNELWLFGGETVEVWSNTGNVKFPFERILGVFIETGCAAKNSIVHNQDGAFWLGSDFTIYQAVGYQAVRISTNPIDTEISKYSMVDDAFGMFYVQNGHRFYCLTFPDANKSWCYDITTQLWHERSSRNPTTLCDDRWLPNCLSFFAGLNLVGDKNSGIIYEVDPDTYTENGTPIIGEIITATIFNSYSRFSTSRLTLLMDTGVGVDGNGQGVNPQIMMQSSIDGAKTWSNELWVEIGEIGSYESEVSWTSLGEGRNLVTKFKISDPVKRSIVGAYVNQEIGSS